MGSKKSQVSKIVLVILAVLVGVFAGFATTILFPIPGAHTTAAMLSAGAGQMRLDNKKSSTLKVLLVAVAVLTGLIVALVAGILLRTSGTNLAASIVLAGGAFGGTVGLVIKIMRALHLLW